MKKGVALFLLGIFCSIVSYAVSPIVGSTTTCVGWTASLSDATPGGSWSSSNTAIATVSSSGLVSGIGAGTCTITYMVGTTYATAAFTVNPANVITGGTSLCTGNSMTLTGWPAGGSWTSGTPTVATVSSGGLVTGVGTGIVNIYYTGGGCYAYQIVNVNPSIPSITGTTTVGTGFTTTLSNTVSGGMWTSSNTAIATVGSGSGIVTGVTAGSCNITYAAGGCYATALVMVTTSISPITGATSTCVGTTATVTATPSGGTWSSSNTSIATISSTGIINGIAAGSVTITYTVSSAYVTRGFTVNTTPSVTGSSTVCTGLTTLMTASPTGGSWSSSNTMIATVGSTGIVTGITGGTVTITYTLAGCSAYKTITVSPTASITGSSTACIGNTTALAGSPSGGTWTSSSTIIASVGSTGMVTGLSAGTTTITYITGGCVAYRPMTVNTSPTVSGGTSVCVGATVPLAGSPSGGLWSSSSTLLATVGSTGIVTGTGAGLVTISYTRSGCSGLYLVSVNSIPSITGPGSLCVGMTTTLAATPVGGSWTSGSPSVATVNPAGLVTAVSPGVVNIYYTVSGCYAFKSITINPAPAPILGTTTVTPGGSSTLSCATPGGIWSSSNPAVATVGSSSGIVSGIASGTCNITYTVGGCYIYVLFTVGSTTLSPITGPSGTCIGSSVTLANSTCCGTWSSSHPGIATVSSSGIVTGISAGSSVITYTVGSAYVVYSFTVYAPAVISGPPSVCTGVPHTLSASVTGGTWSTADTAVASISSAGGLTGISAGTATITYYAGGCYAYYTVTVNAGPVITGSSTLCVGYTSMLTATPSGGSWTSGSPSVATVSTTGLVTGVSNGVVNIYYTQGSCYSFKAITVGTGATITGSSSICVGNTTTLSATPAGGTWSSGSTSLATVGSTGIVTALAAGIVNISYTTASCATYKTVTVTGAPVITGGGSPICSGDMFSFSGSVSGGTWSSSNTAIATVNSSGTVTGVSGGTAYVTYTVGGCFSYAMVTVNTTPTITGSSVACIGTTLSLTGSPSGGTWASSNTFRAIVSPSGVVTGLTGGVVNISYTLGSCYAYKTLTVTGAPVITGGSTVCSGSSTLLSASSGGSWSTSNPAIATVTSTGTVVGISGGTATITYDLGGCFSYKAITVNPTPTITGGSSVCIGTPLSLIGSPSSGVWYSSNPSVATVNAMGQVVGITSGTVTITYTLNGCSAYQTISVGMGSTISGSSSVCSGSTVTLTASMGGGIWSSSNTSVATVTGGIVTGVSAGIATISYTIGGGCSALKSVTVNTAPTITGGSTVCTGTPLSLVGSPFGGSWTSSNPTRATVSSSGVVTGITVGTVNITYTLGSCFVYRTISVSGGVTISGVVPICEGASITLSTSAGGGTWSSAAPAIATVSASGVVSGISAGISNITYMLGSGCFDVKPLTVNSSPLPIVGPGSVSIGGSITLSDPSPGGTWVSYSPSIASVGASTGVVTGLFIGTSDIHYWLGGCSVHKTITVTLFPGFETSTTSTVVLATVANTSTHESKPTDSGQINITLADKAASITVFPNPTNGNITIQWQNVTPGIFDLSITDVAGRRVYSSGISVNVPSMQTNISLNELNDGIYFFTITGSNNYYGKLHIQK